MRNKSLGLLLGGLALLAVAASPIDFAGETFDQRRARLEAMTPIEKEELRNKKERFDALSPQRQEQIRSMHEELLADPNAGQLSRILVHYHEWLKTLSPKQRTDLEKAPFENRVALIRQFRKEQEAQNLRNLASNEKLNQEDMRSIFEWLDDVVRNHEEELLAALPTPNQPKVRAIADDAKRRRVLLFALHQRRHVRSLELPDARDISLLESRLSPEARAALEQARTAGNEAELVRGWIGAAMFSRFSWQFSSEELQQFYAQDLDQQQRERLENQSQEQRNQQLRHMYFRHLYQHWVADEGSGQGGWPPRGGGGPRRGGSSRGDDDRGGRQQGDGDRGSRGGRGRGQDGQDGQERPDAPESQDSGSPASDESTDDTESGEAPAIHSQVDDPPADSAEEDAPNTDDARSGDDPPRGRESRSEGGSRFRRTL